MKIVLVSSVDVKRPLKMQTAGLSDHSRFSAVTREKAIDKHNAMSPMAKFNKNMFISVHSLLFLIMTAQIVELPMMVTIIIKIKVAAATDVSSSVKFTGMALVSLEFTLVASLTIVMSGLLT